MTRIRLDPAGSFPAVDSEAHLESCLIGLFRLASGNQAAVASATLICIDDNFPAWLFLQCSILWAMRDKLQLKEAQLATSNTLTLCSLICKPEVLLMLLCLS